MQQCHPGRPRKRWSSRKKRITHQRRQAFRKPGLRTQALQEKAPLTQSMAQRRTSPPGRGHSRSREGRGGLPSPAVLGQARQTKNAARVPPLLSKDPLGTFDKSRRADSQAGTQPTPDSPATHTARQQSAQSVTHPGPAGGQRSQREPLNPPSGPEALSPTIKGHCLKGSPESPKHPPQPRWLQQVKA